MSKHWLQNWLNTLKIAENKKDEKDCTDGIVDSVKDIIDSVLEDFEELTKDYKDKK